MCAFSFPSNIVREDIINNITPIICESVLDNTNPSDSQTYERMSRILPGYFDYAITIEVDQDFNREYWENSRDCQIMEQMLEIICSDYRIDFMSFSEQQNNASFEYKHTPTDTNSTWLLVIQMHPNVKIGEFMLKLGSMIKRYINDKNHSCLFWVSDASTYIINIFNTSRWIEESDMIMNKKQFSSIRVSMLSNAIARLLMEDYDDENEDEAKIEYITVRNAIEKYIYNIMKKKLM